MPATDALTPAMTPAERKVLNSYGSWTQFMQSFNLKPWDDDDAAEGKAIIAGLAAQDAAEGSNDTNSGTKRA